MLSKMKKLWKYLLNIGAKRVPAYSLFEFLIILAIMFILLSITMPYLKTLIAKLKDLVSTDKLNIFDDLKI